MAPLAHTTRPARGHRGWGVGTGMGCGPVHHRPQWARRPGLGMARGNHWPSVPRQACNHHLLRTGTGPHWGRGWASGPHPTTWHGLEGQQTPAHPWASVALRGRRWGWGPRLPQERRTEEGGLLLPPAQACPPQPVLSSQPSLGPGKERGCDSQTLAFSCSTRHLWAAVPWPWPPTTPPTQPRSWGAPTLAQPPSPACPESSPHPKHSDAERGAQGAGWSPSSHR